MSFLLKLSPLRRPLPSSASSSALKLALPLRPFSQSTPAQLARLTMVGRLGADPELKQSKGGSDYVQYVVGSGHGPKEARQTSWFRVASFAPEGPGREYTLGLTKGTLIYLEGDATMRTYEDAEGKKQSALSLVQTKVEVLKRPQATGEEVVA